MSALQPPLPNAFIAGAQKSGTTALHRLLESHPSVFTPPDRQEIHFFDLDENYRRGLGWYRSLFEGAADESVIFQTSPLYLYQPEVPRRIAEACPDARLIFILRDPTARAYSHYWHEIRFGWERLSFEAALDREPERLLQGERGMGPSLARRHFSYVDRGRYAAQLRRYFEVFPRDRCLVLLTEELRHDRAEVGRRLAAFLDLEAEPWVAHLGAEPAPRHNRNRMPRVRALQRWVRPWRRRLPALAWGIDRINLRDVRYPPMAAATEDRLRRLFADEIQALEDLLGLDLSAWKKPRAAHV